MADIPSTVDGASAETATASGAVESSSKKEQITEIAMNLLVQGRRHLLVSDIPSAIAALAESSQLLVEQYGEFADECAESYYYYGMALLEMARTNTDVLGDAVEGEKEGEDSSESEDEENGDDEDESEEEEEEKVANGEMKTNGEAEKSAESECKENIDGSKEEKSSSEDAQEKMKPKEEEGKSGDVEMKESSEQTKGNDSELNSDRKALEDIDGKSEETIVAKPKNESKGKSLKAAGPATGDKVDSADEDITADEVSNLQLAWEVFELAKNIYQRKAETDPLAKPKLADALIRLAEVAIESENYASAIEDLQKCLEIQKASFPADSRSVAETHYQLGVAYTFTTDFKEAVNSFEAAASVIQLRIENLKNPAEKKPSMEEPKNLFHTIEGEIEELETLLPDIREKIADTIDLEKEALRKIAENGTSEPGTSTNSAAGNGSMETEVATLSGESPSAGKPATDITHLIRKKRKPEDNAETDASAAKKICPGVAVADAAVV
ncbi:histone-binding protein N1/N2-like [Daphnia carinata]|uniref:histone-binding protein N1/N2-like n=1 Tax=Daphnia carinata TaxID=120202 RepID=UPI00257C8B85|nr:histone-binding protein N1/N2-like [Daphnia carinata]